MKHKKLLSILFAAASAVLLTGASSCEEVLNNPEQFITDHYDKTPSYVITIHEIIKYRRGDMVEKEVDSFFGGTVCVNKNSYLHSRDIMKAEMIRRKNDEFYDLALTLTERGQRIWCALSVNMRSQGSTELAFVVDGMYYRSFKPELLTDNETMTVILEGPFDPANAAGISKNAERNYRIFND